MMRWWIAAAAMAAAAGAAPAQQAPEGSLNARMRGDIVPVHDPAVIREGDTYYLFATTQEKDGGGMIHIRTSKDLVTWTRAGSVFPAMPAWTKQTVPGTVGIWAPDIARVGDRYRLYYSVSTFGKNRSAIGLATTASLDPNNPAYGWRDEGVVFTSDLKDRYNAIDPNLVVTPEGEQWLSFGSFWDGLKMFKLDPATGKPAEADPKLVSLASRRSPGAVEAPFIIRRGDYYYLFASYDFCCRGKDSSYYTVAGRSTSVEGPYVDADGKALMDGGGQIVLHASLDPKKRWRGPGHVAILGDGQRHAIVYHAYDAENKGVPTLRIQPLGWSADGWPVAR